MVEGENEDDLLGEDLMDMEADIVKLTKRDARNSDDKGLLERSKPSSSYKHGGKCRALWVYSKKVEFFAEDLQSFTDPHLGTHHTHEAPPGP
ncbi:hypothetical protein Bca52824_073320 [Brassica carinata]|uniref:Uncharacterized protein n=1 Tax=Brassica carinata TaxID=52824 RepID=A0A8X7U7U6_BRACI|nr:hypothetical protein Bca52824_073320 [Brassica carinata]